MLGVGRGFACAFQCLHLSLDHTTSPDQTDWNDVFETCTVTECKDYKIVIIVRILLTVKMPVSRSHNTGPKCSENSEYGPHNNRGHKRPRSQLSNGPSVSRNHVSSPPGWENQARPGSWPPLYLGGGSALGAGPTINIPDSRFGYSSPRPPTRYSQVSYAPPL